MHSFHTQLGLQGARLVVYPSMYNSTVVSGLVSSCGKDKLTDLVSQ